ncbi:MAG: HD domain-containing protein [Pirellulales bacterium]|nr:HD domain-containing protein [Pirellulales bacterium]
MPATDDASTISKASPDLIPVSIESLRALIDFLQVDLYIEQERSKALILYRDRAHPVKQSDLDRLAQRGTKTLYLSLADRDGSHQTIADKVCRNERLAPERRFRVLHDFGRTAFHRVLGDSSLDAFVGMANGLAQRMTGLICRGDVVVQDLLGLLDYDNQLYTHSLNVAACSLLLAQGLGIRDPGELQSLAVGALLHDVGKRHVVLSILKKPGPLNARQRKEIQNHPTTGFRDLMRRGELSWPQAMMVYQHHERCDGSGYPVGVVGDEIHPWARLCAVADVYCALTSDTPYRKQKPVHQALDILDDEAEASLDKEMVRCWKAITAARAPSLSS